MLKYIKVKNFLSFKDETIINFESDNRGNKKDNVFKEKNTVLNKSLLIYWANASGKTNILNVINFIRYVAVSVDWILQCTPFLLDAQLQKESSDFEVWYFYDNREYKYSFSILDNIFVEEKFSKIVGEKEITLFCRQRGKSIKTKDKNFQKEIDKWEGKARDNVSFLAVLWQRNGLLYNRPINEFFAKINVIPSSIETLNQNFTTNFLWLKERKNIDIVVDFLKCADIDIDDVRVIEVERPLIQINGVVLGNPDTVKVKENVVQFWHKVKWSKELQYFDAFTVESWWTRKLFVLLWMILDTIINEKMLFIDEIECNLHPHILKNIFDLIHADLGKKYQFICTTHSMELMNLSMFKKSQIWITQKKKDNSTEFYTIDDFEDLRSENDIKKMYNIWSLWWVPFVSDLSILIEEFQKWKGR